jgi:hypothetical protein
MPNAEIARTQHNARPIVLLVAGNWWPIAARMAAAFIEHGCLVAALCPRGHPLRYVRGVHQIRTLRGLSPRRSLELAVLGIRPDLVVPCDDRSVAQLHELHRLRPQLRTLIERSLGEPHGFNVVDSRQALLETARELGIRVARTFGVGSAAQASECFARAGPTAMLKMDNTSGGDGVYVTRSASEAAAAFRRTRFEATLALAFKRLVVNRDPMALWSWSQRRRQIGVTLQQFVRGTPANIMVACWRGKILAELSVQALSSQGPTGASLVVQVITDPQLSRAAALLAGRLKMSGFFGLDFILEQGTGAAYLIEMNPRCTQLGHLKMAPGDLAGALCAALIGRERPRAKQPIVSDTIAFFPQAFLWGAQTAFLERVHHDVPWEQRNLVRALLQDPWPNRHWLARLYHWFRRPAALEATQTVPTDRSMEGAAALHAPADHATSSRLLHGRR